MADVKASSLSDTTGSPVLPPQSVEISPTSLAPSMVSKDPYWILPRIRPDEHTVSLPVRVKLSSTVPSTLAVSPEISPCTTPPGPTIKCLTATLPTILPSMRAVPSIASEAPSGGSRCRRRIRNLNRNHSYICPISKVCFVSQVLSMLLTAF